MLWKRKRFPQYSQARERPSGSTAAIEVKEKSVGLLAGGLEADLGVEVNSEELFAGVSALCDCFSGGVADSALVGVTLLLSLVLLLLLLLLLLLVLLLLLLLLGTMEGVPIFVAGGGLLLGLVNGGVSFLGDGEGLPLAADPGLVVPAS